MHANGMDKPCIIGGESSLKVLSTEKETQRKLKKTETKVSTGLDNFKSEYLVRE